MKSLPALGGNSNDSEERLKNIRCKKLQKAVEAHQPKYTEATTIVPFFSLYFYSLCDEST